MELNRTVKIVVIGEKKCGKTALTVRFLTGKFIYEYATGEDLIYPHTLPLASGDVQLKIIDTSKHTIPSNIIDAADCVIIVYAINNIKSFRRAKDLLSHIENRKDMNQPCIAIVANKSDMWHYRLVMRSDGEYLAKKHECKYFELSALIDKEGVERMFNVMVRLIHDKTESTLKCNSVVILDRLPSDDVGQYRQRSRSLQLPVKEKKFTTQKSPLLFRKILKSWSNSSLNRSKSTEKLLF